MALRIFTSRAFSSTAAAATNTRVAVILSGNGVYDGTECTEAVSCFIHLARHGADYQCYAPNKMQMHAVNHTSGEEHSDNRNVFEESARLSRGNVKALNELDASNYDALIIPGGFGAAKNLSTWATEGPNCSVDNEVSRVIGDFHNQKKAMGACCIAPTLFAKCIPNAKVTVGSDNTNDESNWPYAGTAGGIIEAGGNHIPTDYDGVVIDDENKLSTSPAYMYEGKPNEIFDSVGNMITAVMKMC